MDAKQPRGDAASASRWCTRAVWRLLGHAGRTGEAATIVYRTGPEGLRRFVCDLVDVEAVGYTGSGAACLLRALLRDVDWDGLAAAAAARYDPEAEYAVVQLAPGAAGPVVLATTVHAGREAALAAARDVARDRRSPGAHPGASTIEVRRQPRHPQPAEVVLALPVGPPATRPDPRAG